MKTYLYIGALAFSAVIGVSQAQSTTDNHNSLRGQEMVQGPSKVAISDHVEWAKDLVSQQLKDPDSAKFRNVFYAVSNTYPPKQYVCGEVNAKNSYGGYPHPIPHNFFVINLLAEAFSE